MKTNQIGFIAGLAFLLVSVTVRAQSDIISAADFMELVKTDNNLVIIDAGKADNYKKSHIKNAINIPAGDLAQEDGMIHGLLKSPAELAELFGSKGVTESSMIIVYDEGSQKYSSRVYWVLKYLGATQVKMLHKDKDTFKKSRVRRASRPTKARAAVIFTPKVNPAVMADDSFLKSGKSIIIDARSDEEFNGSAGYSKGHIPGAVHLNYKNLLNNKGAFLPKEEMESVVAKYGLTPDTQIAVYCRSGVRATVLYSAFVNVLGYNNVKVYDGSYLEWVAKGNKVDQ